jgi:TPR repeat protein
MKRKRKMMIHNVGAYDFSKDSKDPEFQALLAKAAAGDPEMQFELGFYYYNGDISASGEYEFTDDEYAKANYWWTKAAEQNHTNAQYNLGTCYLHGRGAERDCTKAVCWYGKAAEQGHAGAQFVMGYCCFHGIEMESDAEKAVFWLMRAAKQGNANAWYYMGECCRTGTGVVKDDQKAADWYNGAAEQGHNDAVRMLEIFYPSRPTPSFIHMQIQPDVEAARQGNEHAQFVLGNAYYDGEFMPKDRSQAAVWFRQSAEQGYAPSQNNLGCYYYNGWEVKTDDERAAYWFGKAAEQDNANAQFNLSICYERGFGVEQDSKAAAEYLIKAVQQGNQAARLYHYVKTLCTSPNTKAAELSTLMPLPAFVKGRPLDEVVSRLEETFSECLLRLINERNKKDADVYNRANIDRRTFSKIRSNKDYRPSKNTVFAFAIALELSLDDTRDLLMKAGFALSRSNKMDLIIEYFISEGNYDIFEVNEALYSFGQSLLGV